MYHTISADILPIDRIINSVHQETVYSENILVHLNAGGEVSDDVPIVM